MTNRKYGICHKCQTTWVIVTEYKGGWLCEDNCCLQEEMEKDTGKHLRDEKDLNDYRALVAGTWNVPRTNYSG